MEQEPERCDSCGHFEAKHKDGLCHGVYLERTACELGDIAIGCKCKNFEP